ncbi:Ubiquitin-conjugating enzyme/RWD-like protein [Pseudocohnilembus persalinus]|uniref:Ubiquitin-conjugating enzyme/RWD-like protein n=1 Tax=Pseudocohnilembus persalinus TaxID=266149 RepID=A0A0V0QJU7_PSEPJ|nr:Ubiquitin-conjugating enzyme/RWD-like protein [Pseudocohnilembus persalinus]|eukprot:KRX02559.1 Ubiquitin-conjugating enzyme/RWD-like protein [Pseudocohnilembus persalinus]
MNPKAQKRIIKEYLNVQNNPLPGIAITQKQKNDYQSFIVNIKVLDGIYKNICLHFELKISNEYPIIAPKVNIFPGQALSYPYHHHIYNTWMCVDILEDAWMNPKVIGTGWTSAYTLETILIQIQAFMGDPDFPKNRLPTKKEVQGNLIERQKFFSHVLNNLEGKSVVHTWENPYPPFPQQINQQQYYEQQLKQKLTEKQLVLQQVQCYQLKQNIEDIQNTQTNKHGEDDTNLTLGIPIDLKIDNFNRIYPQPIPEILSLQGYLSEYKQKGFKVLQKYKIEHNLRDLDIKLKSGMGSKYNTWLPIYINKQHFKDNLHIIQYYISLYDQDEMENSQKYVKNQEKQQVFHPGTIFKVLPAVLNKLVVFLLDGSMHTSYQAIQIYIHFAKLFNEFVEYYKDECRAILTKKLNEFLKGDEFRSKRAIGDIGEFIQILMIAKPNFIQDKRIMQALIRELLARQILWVVKEKAKQNYQGNSYEDEAEFSYRTQKVSLQLFLFVVKVAETFGQKDFLREIENNYCVVDENIIKNFINGLNKDFKKLKNHKDWFNYLGFEYDNDIIYNILRDSFTLSNEQGYTFEAKINIMTKEEKKRKEELLKKKQEEKEKQIKERSIQREQRKLKIQQERQEQDQKDFEEIMAFNDEQQQKINNLEKLYENYEKASEEFKQQLKNTEQQLYDKYFDSSDPFAFYQDPLKNKEYEKELKQLKQKYEDDIVKKRNIMLKLEEDVDKIYEQKMKTATKELEKRREQREKEEATKAQQWFLTQKARDLQWKEKKRQYQQQRDKMKIERKQKVEEHKQLTNNGLGFDRLYEARKKEQIEKKKKQQQKIKQNIFLAFEDDEDDQENIIYV